MQEPIGDDRNDWRAALVAYVLATIHSGKARGPEFSDFLPDWGKRLDQKSPEDIETAIKAWAGLHNKAVTRKRK